MALLPGDVILVWDRETHPPKHKLLICVDREKQHFLRINSKPHWQPNHLLLAAESSFLEHDSYVELRQFVRPYAYEINQADHKGRLSAEQAASLAQAAQEARTLSQEHKDLVVDRLGSIRSTDC